MTLDLALDADVDLIKITTNMLSYGQMHETLKNGMIDYIEEHLTKLKYETTSELAVVFASKMDETYKRLFFEKTNQKFIRELRYLKDETIYKIVWAMIKSQTVTVSAQSDEWHSIKAVVSERCNEISPKIMSDLLVLSTMEAVLSEAEST